jgi:ankyrin repeat protein
MGHTEVVRELAKCGAHVDAPREGGALPLSCALYNMHTSTVKALVECGANVQFSLPDGTTALHILSQAKHDEELTREVWSALEKAIGSLDQFRTFAGTVNDAGTTPFLLATQHGNATLVSELEKLGVHNYAN